MATGRDDFVIAIRSAFLKKKDKQKFSLLTLIVLSIFVIVLSNFNFKVIQFVKLGINEVIYRSSHICLLYTSPSPRDQRGSRMPSSA